MSATTEHLCGTMGAPHESGPGAASTAPDLTPRMERDVMPDSNRPRRHRRKEITQRQKWLMFERFGVKADSEEHAVECFYCGETGTAVVVPPGEPRKVWCEWPRYGYEMRPENKWWVRSSLEVDHVRPVALGGKHEVWNFVPACMTCNASKSNRTLGEWFDLLADKRRSKHPRRLVILERFGAES